jgi:hypothetical protein
MASLTMRDRQRLHQRALFGVADQRQRSQRFDGAAAELLPDRVELGLHLGRAGVRRDVGAEQTQAGKRIVDGAGAVGRRGEMQRGTGSRAGPALQAIARHLVPRNSRAMLVRKPCLFNGLLPAPIHQHPSTSPYAGVTQS